MTGATPPGSAVACGHEVTAAAARDVPELPGLFPVPARG